MLKAAIEIFVRKTKNRNFSFDDHISSMNILSLIWEKLISWLRSLKFLNFTKRGRLVFFGKHVKLSMRKNINLGNNVIIGDFVKLSGLGRGKLKLGDNVNIGAFSRIIISTSYNNIGEFIHIGSNVGMGEYSYIGGGGGTTIGDDTIIGQYFSIHPENHLFSNKNKLIREQGVSRKGVYIGSNCWIGSKVTILDGVKIGNSSVVAAGSVVTKSFPERSLIGGVPAKLIKVIE